MGSGGTSMIMWGVWDTSRIMWEWDTSRIMWGVGVHRG